jgi:hypothetical protein
MRASTPEYPESAARQRPDRQFNLHRSCSSTQRLLPGGRYFMTRADDADGQKDPNVMYLTHSAAYGTPGLGEGLLLNLFRLMGRGIRALLRHARR